MAEKDAVPLGRRIRHALRVRRFLVSAFVLGIGFLLTTLAIGDLTPLSSSGPFPAINRYTDQSPNGVNYNLAFVVFGPIIIIIGAYLVAAYLVARRKFEHLMVTRSKAEFLRNLPQIEELLWDLTPVDEARYERKKVELKIRR